MEMELRPRQITEMRRILDTFLTDHGIPDNLLVRTRREEEELTREAFTHALLGREEMTLHFHQDHFSSLHFTCNRSGSPIEFVRIIGNDSQASSHWSRELNTFFTMSANNALPPLERVLRTLSDFGKSQVPLRKRFSSQLTSFLQTLPIWKVPSPTFLARLSQRGQVDHRRFKVVYQFGNTLRLDVIEIALPEEGKACFLAANGILTAWHTDKDH